MKSQDTKTIGAIIPKAFDIIYKYIDEDMVKRKIPVTIFQFTSGARAYVFDKKYKKRLPYDKSTRQPYLGMKKNPWYVYDLGLQIVADLFETEPEA